MTMQPASSNIPIKNNAGIAILRIFILVTVIALTIYIYHMRDEARALANYGYGGIFLLSILANSTIILPAPGLLFVFALGGVFNPIGVALAAGAGAAIGELTGYLAGFSGQGVVENVEMYRSMRAWMIEHPRWVGFAIMGLAFIPLPLFDLAGMAAGALRMPVWNFLLWCMLGKILKMLVIAYAGSFSLGRLGW
jgi:membrane protein YqaA with SNARE-associated domain